MTGSAAPSGATAEPTTPAAPTARAVRAVRGATGLAADDRAELLDAVTELMVTLFERNGLTPGDVISVIFTTTPDLHSEFPALAARQLGLGDVPLLCAQEIAVVGAMPRVVRVLAHVETARSRAEIRHVYLRGTEALRKDLAQ